MANAEHVAILQSGVTTWNSWLKDNYEELLKARGNNICIADLSGADLDGIDIRGANFYLTSLSGANLRGSDLSDASLQKARLHKANLKAAILVRADLSEARFNRADLTDAKLAHGTADYAYFLDTQMTGADLSNLKCIETDFSGADLSGANLSGASFIDCNCEEIVLQGANLWSASFNGTKLLKADLRSANLYGATFVHSSLEKAQLADASLGQTIIGSSNLTDVVGLTSCTHVAPSIVDPKSIELSGSLPDVFLRGCGWLDRWIQYSTALSDQAINYYSCFISYSHADKSFARRLHDQLQGEGIRCWLDEHQLLPGDDIYEQVDTPPPIGVV